MATSLRERGLRESAEECVRGVREDVGGLVRKRTRQRMCRWAECEVDLLRRETELIDRCRRERMRPQRSQHPGWSALQRVFRRKCQRICEQIRRQTAVEIGRAHV